MFKLLINGSDYTKYLVPSISPVLDDSLNQSNILTFALYAADSGFNLVLQNETVKLLSDTDIFFTGYVIATPTIEIVDNNIAGYNVVAQSEEWLFNTRTFGVIPDYVGQFAGDILKSLINQINPSNTFDMSLVPQGPFIPVFKVNPSWNFTKAAAALAQKVGFRWWILDGKVNFAPQNDSVYGYSIDSTQPNFNLLSLVLTQSSAAIVNDANVIGPSEPQTFVEEGYLGDTIQQSYDLRQPVFGSIASTTIFSDFLQSASLDTTLWKLVDTTHTVSYSSANLIVSGSSALGKTVLYSNNSFELGGELLFDHGLFNFNDLSVGIAGGLYSITTFLENSCIAGFWFTGNPVRTGITAIINGVKTGSTVVTQKNHTYRLRTYVSADQTYRYQDIFRSITGQFGGDILPSDAYVTLVVLDTDLGNPQAAPVQTVIYDQKITNIPAFAYYALFNSLGMYINITQGPKVYRLPNVRVRSSINGRVNATLSQDTNTNIWTVGLSSPAASLESITVRYRKLGIAQTRLLNNTSINSIGKQSVTITAIPILRSTADCENLGQSYLSDHISKLYEGNYTSFATKLVKVPKSGKFVNVNHPIVTTQFVSIVREVKITFTDFANQLGTVQTFFGFAPLMEIYSVSNVAGSITGTDFTTLPQFLSPISSITEGSITSTVLNAVAGRNPTRFYEARSTDDSWGAGITGNFLNQFSTTALSFNRITRNDTFYVREIDDALVPKSSRYATLLMAPGYPLQPPAPSGTSSIVITATSITYTVVLSSTTDVNGVEIRATDNSTVIYHQTFNFNSDLVFVTPNTGNVTSLSNYNFYTFNVRGDYSNPTLISGGVVAPNAPNTPTGLAAPSAIIVIATDGTASVNTNLTWVASTTGIVTGYQIRYATAANPTNYQYVTVGIVTSTTLLGLALGTAYKIGIKALGIDGSSSAFSTDISYTTPATPVAGPTTPSGLTAIGGFRNIGLSWTANTEPDLAGYIIQFSTNNSAFSQISKSTTTLFIDNGDQVRGSLAISTQYWYKIAAFNTSGQISAFTASATATTTAVGNSDIVANTINGDRILANSITAAKITSVNAASVTGVLAAANIPSLDFSKITTGTLWGQDITTTTIDGSHITTGTVTANQLSAVSRFSISRSIQFTGNSSGLTWTAGNFIVPNSSGVNTSYSISAQATPIVNPSASNTKYVYFSASASITVFQVTGNVADGSVPTIPADGFVVAVWHGNADIAVLSGQTVIDGGHIQTRTINANNIVTGTLTSNELTTGSLLVGGSTNMPALIDVKDTGAISVALIGTFSSTQLGGTVYGGWFKTLEVGGTKDAPNMYSDTSGNLVLLNGDIRYQATVNGVPVLVGAQNGHGFYEYFEKDVTTYWNLRAGGSAGITYPTNGITGGKVLSTTQYAWYAFPNNIAFDPSKLYRMRTRVRKTSGAGGSQVYVGVEGVAADGTTLVNTAGANLPSNQHYICVSGNNLAVSSTWSEFTGYFKGTAATGSGIPSTDTGIPSVLHTNVRYMRPLFILDFSGLTDTWEIDYITIDIIPDSTDIIADGTASERMASSNTLMPDLPFNGDYEQFPESQVIASGWTKGFQTTGTITDANYARSVSAFRGNFAQNILSADNVKGTSVASRPFGVKEFLQYQFQVRAKIDVKPTGNHGFYFRVAWYNDDNDLSFAGRSSANDIVVGTSAAFTVAAGTYQTFTGILSAPASARFCRIALYNWGPDKGSNTATVITVDTVTVQLQSVNKLITVAGTTFSPTTNLNGLTVIPEMSITLTTRGGPVLLIFSGNISCDNAGGQQQGVFQFERDGVQLGTFLVETFAVANLSQLVTFTHIDTAAAGSHTYDARWMTNGGGQTLTAQGIQREFQVCELP
jgi:hypothetical protein